MAEAEEGEITENEISEEEENNEEPIAAEDLKQVAEENEILIEDLIGQKTDDQALTEVENEEDEIEEPEKEGEGKEAEGTEAEGTEAEGIEEEGMKEDGTGDKGMEEGEMGEEESEETEVKKEEEELKPEDAKAEQIEEKSEKPPESIALKGRIDDKTMKKLEQVEKEVNEAANSIYTLKGRAEELLKKENMTEDEEKELEEVNAELKKQMDLFDEKTKEIQDIIANTNILETMPVRIPQAKHEEDVLPRVLLCGELEDYVPKIVVCNQKTKASSPAARECMPGCPGSSTPPTMTPSPKKICGNEEGQKALSCEHADLDNMRSRLEEDISHKDKILEGLQLNLVSLQNEIKMVSTENTVLNERIRKLQQNQANQKQQLNEPKKMCPSMMAAKLQQYSEYTRRLEKQLAEMEKDFNNVHREICAAQKERDCLEQTRNTMAKPFCRKK